MKKAIVVLALVALVKGQDGIRERICEPDSTKMEDCNSCFCIGDGSGWTCTEIGCPEIKVNTRNKREEIKVPSNRGTGLHHVNPYNRLLRLKTTSESQVCVPKSTKMEACNTCFCIEDGSGWACTEKGCVDTIIESVNRDATIIRRDEQPSQRVERDVDAPFSCVPNERFKMDCNWCTCTEDGRSAMCTLMGCSSAKYWPATPEPIPVARKTE